MRLVVQRVLNASCSVGGSIISNIDKGYMVLVGFCRNDTMDDVVFMAKKLAKLRIFEDENKKMNLDIKTVSGSILAISQFTLYADSKGNNRPSFTEAMNYEDSNDLYEKFVNYLIQDLNIETKKGVFGADMKISLINDGPVTIIIDSNDLKSKKKV